MKKFAPAPVSHRYDYLISYRLYMIRAARRNGSHFSSSSTLPSWIEETYACVTRSSLARDRFHTETSGCSSSDTFWWFHVNQYRVTRGNRSELAPGQKSPRYRVKYPLSADRNNRGLWGRQWLKALRHFVCT